jgi:fatty acid desaturase
LIVADERDLPLVYLLINVTATVVPLVIVLILSTPSHAYGIAYLATVYGLYLQRFMLALHYGTHVAAFRNNLFIGRMLNALAPMVLAPLFGIPSGVYALHHAVMHHVENNKVGKDLSSTAGFQRDSVLAFLTYWLRFTVGSCVELPMYAWRQKRYSMAAQCALGFAGTFAVYSFTARINSVAALWIFVVPYFVSSLALMFGNWSQHVFVDPDRPHCNYRLSYCAINHSDNQHTFNDGYHTVHHVNSRVHWSELPSKFLASLDDYAENDGLIFTGVGFFDVGIAVMRGKLDWLADKYVHVGQPSRSKEEIIALLRHRLQPVRTKSA